MGVQGGCCANEPEPLSSRWRPLRRPTRDPRWLFGAGPPGQVRLGGHGLTTASKSGDTNFLNEASSFCCKHVHFLWRPRMRRSSVAVPLAILLMILAQSPRALFCQKNRSENAPPPTVSPAADGIFTAFQRRPIVALSDDHGMAQEEDFYASLVRDERFPDAVGNVVVEFGDAAQQATLDRYLAGDAIPYEDLRRVWSDTVGWIPTVDALGYVNFFAQVRAVNLGLPADKRIRVWLGDPPIDWSKIKTKEDFFPKLAQRNQYPADIIKTEILAKGKKALVIYGGFHFYGEKSLRGLVEHDYPGTFFVVTVYRGFTDSTCSKVFEKAIRTWPIPALAAPVRGTTLKGLLRPPRCHFLSSNFVRFGPDVSQAEAAKQRATLEGHISGVDGDALLFLGPASSLTYSPQLGDLYFDSAFRKEIDRRSLIEIGQPLSPFIPPASPRYLHKAAGR